MGKLVITVIHSQVITVIHWKLHDKTYHCRSSHKQCQTSAVIDNPPLVLHFDYEAAVASFELHACMLQQYIDTMEVSLPQHLSDYISETTQYFEFVQEDTFDVLPSSRCGRGKLVVSRDALHVAE